MNSIPYLDELTSCKCKCLCLGPDQKFCVTKNSIERLTEVLLNGNFELGNQDWILAGDAQITQDLLGNWFGGVLLSPNSSYRGTLEQSFIISSDSSCELRYDAFNNFDEPNVPLIQGIVSLVITDSSNNIIFSNTTGEGVSESILELLSLSPDTYTMQITVDGATLNTVSRSGVDNVSLICKEVEFLDCVVTLLPDNITLPQIDINDSTFCVEIPESSECKYLEVQCENIEDIPLSDWEEPIENPISINDGDSISLRFPVDLACTPNEVIVHITMLTPHNGSSITLSGDLSFGFPLTNTPNEQSWSSTANSVSRIDIDIDNNSGITQEYIIRAEYKNNCKRNTIEFKTCEDCDKGCLVEWTDKCTGEKYSFYIPGDIITTPADFNVEEYLNSAGILSLIGKNKTNKQYELITDGICDEIYCLISEAMTQDSFKINGVLVIPTSSGSFDGAGSRNAIFSFKKAKQKDESCCC